MIRKYRFVKRYHPSDGKGRKGRLLEERRPCVSTIVVALTRCRSTESANVCIVNARGGSGEVILVIKPLLSATGRTSNAKSNPHVGEGVVQGDVLYAFDFLFHTWVIEDVRRQACLEAKQTACQ